MAFLLYGSGLRLLECCRLRVQDVDLATNQIVIRGAKGDKDRVTVLPAVIKPDLARHLDRGRAQHQRDLQSGAGWVELRPRWPESTRTLDASGCDSGSSPPRGCFETGPPGSFAGTTSTNPCSSVS